jgi:hypothetical protein
MSKARAATAKVKERNYNSEATQLKSDLVGYSKDPSPRADTEEAGKLSFSRTERLRSFCSRRDGMARLQALVSTLPSSADVVIIGSIALIVLSSYHCAAQEQSSLTGDQALARLMEGNKRFVSRKAQHPDQSLVHIREVESGQHPFAVVLSCSDSRVGPEIIFDQGLGDLFVIRVAGNGRTTPWLAVSNTPLNTSRLRWSSCSPTRVVERCKLR